MKKIEWFNSVEFYSKKTWTRTKNDFRNNEFFRMICQRLLNENNPDFSIVW